MLIGLLTALGMTAGFPAPASAQAGGGAGIETRANVEYSNAGGQALLMDAHLPEGAGPFPALIAIHGGGFVRGDKTLMRGVSIYFARNGYAVFSIDYRLAPEFPYPAAVQDAQAAVTFVRQHAADYKVDPAKVGAIGGSAGGTIAVSMAAESKGHFSTGTGIATAVSWSGALDLAGVLSDRSAKPGVASSVLDYAGVSGADPTSPQAQTALKTASPSDQIEKGDPPMFIANAQQELMPIAQAEAFVAKLKSLGITNQTLTPAMGHALKYAQEAEPPTLSFLNQYLRDLKAGGPTESPSASASSSPITEPTTSPSPVSKGSSLLFPAIIVVGIIVLLILIVGPAISSARRKRRSHRY
jgi:acetyl esterase